MRYVPVGPAGAPRALRGAAWPDRVSGREPGRKRRRGRVHSAARRHSGCEPTVGGESGQAGGALVKTVLLLR